MAKQNYDYVFLLPGNTFSKQFLVSWTNTLINCYKNNKTFYYRNYYTPIITQTRNGLIGADPLAVFDTYNVSTKVFNNKLRYKKVIFIDSDMVWDITALELLLKSPHDITVAPYWQTGNQKTSIKLTEKDDFMSADEINKHTKPFEIHSAGLGFVACNAGVLEKMEFPWFQSYQSTLTENGTERADTIGEDIYFFMKAKHYGFKTYCDPQIKVGHEKSTILTI